MTKCSICGSIALQDQYGNGECKNCGWKFSKDEKIFEQVYQQIRYQKKTISFLRAILNHYGVPNDLSKYLSPLSEYNHPTMEEIYESSQLS